MRKSGDISKKLDPAPKKTGEKNFFTVVHLISGLGKGGAETMLCQIATNRTNPYLRHVIVSLGLSHYYEKVLEENKIKVIVLDIKRRPLNSLRRLHSICKKTEIICCWMYISCLLGTLLSRRWAKKIIWCIRHSDLSRDNNSISTLLAIKLCAKLSKKADMITYNGNRAKEAHKAAGYQSKKEYVLYNGLSLTEYKKNNESRDRLQQVLGIEGKTVILSVARNNPIKDLPTFVKTFAEIKKDIYNAVALMCGTGVDYDNLTLVNLISEVGLKIGRDIKLLGFREDIPVLMSAADLYILHSVGEAFPNTLIQAMACETLVVATDVGDVKEILGEDLYVSSPRDYVSLAKSAIRLLSLSDREKEKKRESNREIIKNKYDIKNVVRKYEDIFEI